MKRVIFGILILIGAWKLVQLPSVNAALLAFLTLGINPLTNRPFTTPSLVSILLAVGLIIIPLFFSRMISDFFGGVYDWLTRAEHTYIAPREETARLFMTDIASAPVHEQKKKLAKSTIHPIRSVSKKLAIVTHRIHMSEINLRPIKSRRAGLTQWYILFVYGLRTRLRVARSGMWSQKLIRPQKKQQTKTHNVELAPELAEVLAIFEQLDRDTVTQQPQEAMIVEKDEPRKPNTMVVYVQSKLRQLNLLLVTTQRKTRNSVAQSSDKVGRSLKTTRRQAGHNVHKMRVSGTRRARALRQRVYRGVLLLVLGLLLVVGKFLGAAQYVARRIRRAAVHGAAMVTLGMFAMGRGALIVAHLVGSGLAAASRATYWILAHTVMFMFLGTGYLLFVFELVVFMVWELCEPFARKLDRWLGSSFDHSGELTEATKVGREMSRTFVQWYRGLRNFTHSIYH